MIKKGVIDVMYKLLIAEDEEYTRNFLKSHVEQRFKNVFETEDVADGKKAFEKIQSNEYDILLTDIRMPYFSGVDLAEYIKENKLSAFTILLSGYEEFEYARRGIAAGVRLYLVKPYDIALLDKKLEELIAELNTQKASHNVFVTKDIFEKTEEFFVNLIYGERESKASVEQIAVELQIPFDLNTAKCDIIELSLEEYDTFLKNNITYTKDSLNTAVDNLVSGFIGSAHVYCIKRENGFFEYIVFSTGREKTNYDSVAKKISGILKFDIKVTNEETGFSNIYELIDSKSKEININEKALIVSSCISVQKFSRAMRIIDNVKETGEEKAREFLKLLRFSGSPDTPTEEILNEIKKSLPVLSGSKNGAMEKAVEYIRKNYGKNISREDVAKAVFFSPAYFARNFKQYTGKSCNEYLLEVRMEKAKEMLNENKYRIYEIAQLVGYENTKYFYRIFKLYTGYTPKDYVQQISAKRPPPANSDKTD